MKMTVRGIQMVDYISKKTGKPVKGVTLFCSHKEQAVDGEMTEDVFVSDSLDCARLAYALKPGSLIDVEYNRRGYVADLCVLDSKPASTAEPANTGESAGTTEPANTGESAGTTEPADTKKSK